MIIRHSNGDGFPWGFAIECALIAGLIAVVIYAGFTTLAHGPM